MNRTISLVAIAVAASSLAVGVAAQGMAHITMKDASGQPVGMAMITEAKGGGVSIAIDFKGSAR